MIKWLWSHSFLNYLVRYIKSASEYRRDKKQYGPILYGGYFSMLVEKYLKVKLEKDWIGRLYGIVNPNTDIEGNFDPSTVIIEIDGNDTNSNEYVKTWIYKQLRLLSSLFSLKEFYDRVNLDIRPVGPEGMDNYLVVFEFASRPERAYWRKKLLLRASFILAVAAATIAAVAFI